jgi:hypothetical protein
MNDVYSTYTCHTAIRYYSSHVLLTAGCQPLTLGNLLIEVSLSAPQGPRHSPANSGGHDHAGNVCLRQRRVVPFCSGDFGGTFWMTEPGSRMPRDTEHVGKIWSRDYSNHSMQSMQSQMAAAMTNDVKRRKVLLRKLKPAILTGNRRIVVIARKRIGWTWLRLNLTCILNYLDGHEHVRRNTVTHYNCRAVWLSMRQ